MKKIYILIITILSLQSFSQKDNSRYYNSWRLGLNGGAAWQTADMRSCWGGAGGFTLEKGLGENATNFFSFAIRGRYLAANTYGMDYVRNYNFKDNDAYNGKYDLGLNYADTAKYKRGYVYDNYKMTLGEGSLELQLTFNRLRERTGVLLNLWGGVGVTSYRTKTDLLDGDGKLYDFSKVDSSGTTKAINTYNSLIDKKYESNAYGSKNGNLVTFSPSGGVGLGYQFTPGFSMLLEYKITLPQGTSADLLDGKYSNNSDAIGGNNDYYHYAGLNLLFTLRGKKKDRVVKDETVYTNTVVPTNSIVTTNTTIPTNSIVPTSTVVAELKPIVSFINPPVSGQITNNSQYKISAQVLNVSTANQIQFKFNSLIKSNFTFNPQTHILEYYSNLNLGSNPIQIIATNTAGSDNETTTVIYEQPKPAGNPPAITITNPSACPFNVQISQFNAVAYVSNVTAKNNISVKVNNAATTNFEYNPTTGQVNIPMSLVNGNNSISITVTNQVGSNSKSCSINYAAPQQTIPPPIITFINPIQPGQVSATPTYSVKAQILNIAGQNGASVYVNGMSVPFVYNATTKQVSFSANLIAGSNPITIYANNTVGDDAKATEIIYNQPVASGNPPQVNLINPSVATTSTSVSFSNFKLAVLNVNSKNDINVVYNGVATSSFTYNTVTKQLDYSANLINGINTFYVKGTNAFGNDSKTLYVTYKAQEKEKTPPAVTIVNPAISPASTSISNYTFKATITNVPNTAGLIVKHNGTVVTNYTYDGLNLNYPVSLIAGNNNFEVTGTNPDGSSTKAALVIYRIKQTVVPPVVNLINPALVANATNNQLCLFKFSVLNVASKNDIEVKFNGVAELNFTYNSTTKEIDFSKNLALGNNIVTVKGTNSVGSDEKEVSVVYEPHVAIKLPPVITMIAPVNSPALSQSPAYLIKATVSNIPNTAGLTVKFNGSVITNYTYDGFNLNYQANLLQGNNMFEVTAHNNDGNDAKAVTIKYQPKVVAIPAPIVSLINPASEINATDNPNCNFKLSVLNVSSQSDIEVLFNGVAQSNFIYNTTSKEVTFSSNLNEGNNILNVKGTNVSGSDSKQISVIYTPHQDLQTPPAVTFITPSNGSGSSAAPSYVFKATITNMSTANGLVVKYNGAVVTNYTYNGSLLEYSTNLNQGNNSLEVSATNTDGSDTKTATVNYKARVIVSPPVVTIIQPVNNPVVHSDSYNFQFTATHVNQNQVEVYLNGNAVSAFNFNASNGNFNSNLVTGVNTLMVKATNAGGVDSKTSMITYEPIAETPTVTTTPTVTPTRITICHIPPGNNQNPQTITISANAWPAHQAHGDVMGACPVNTSTVVVTTTTATTTNTTTTTTTTTTTSGSDEKITICHIPPGNNQNPQTITISPSAWPAHQAHGDVMGACPVNRNQNNDGKLNPKTKGVIQPLENKTNQVVDTVKKVITTPVNTPRKPR